MFQIKSFGIIGGDKRQLYCAKAIAADGYSVAVAGFDKDIPLMGLTALSMTQALAVSDAIILPLPCSRDGININSPFSEAPLSIQENLELFLNKPVFCGMKQRLPFSHDHVYDYSGREEFAVENAVPTSEGAIEIAMREYEGTVNGSSCLVAGYGRIGRVLSDMLSGLGAKVTVGARSLRDLAFIRAKGYNAVSTLSLSGSYDIIFNTVPHLIFDAPTLAATAANALVIDLASMPGGVDFEAAERLSIKAIHALSLPGKAAPKKAGTIIKNAVYHIIREEQL